MVSPGSVESLGRGFATAYPVTGRGLIFSASWFGLLLGFRAGLVSGLICDSVVFYLVWLRLLDSHLHILGSGSF